MMVHRGESMWKKRCYQKSCVYKVVSEVGFRCVDVKKVVNDDDLC